MRCRKPALSAGSERKATAILAADIHLRDTTPVCRTDDFRGAMERKLDFIRALQKEHGGIPVLVAGDVFDHWKPSPELLRWSIEHIQNWICIPGQHDLPQHSLELYGKSGLAVLEAAGCVTVLTDSYYEYVTETTQIVGFPWGVEPGPISKLNNYAVALVHRLVYLGEAPFPGAEVSGSTAKALLQKMEGFDLVVTGDNHETFVVNEDSVTSYRWTVGSCGNGERLLINPGSMMRTTVKQAEHEPCVFLWYTGTNTVERVVLPHRKGVVDRTHLDRIEERDERLEAFVSRLREDVEVGLNYRENLKHYLQSNPVPKAIKDIVWEVLP